MLCFEGQFYPFGQITNNDFINPQVGQLQLHQIL